MNNIEVCLSPELIHQHSLKGKIVVVVDIFRATSCIVTGFANEVASFTAVSEIDETKELGRQGFLMAGERGGQKIKEFDLGNSPFEYENERVKGAKVAISTTNGSQAIIKSAEADEVLIGAFLNLDAIVSYVLQIKKDVVVHCAGWKGTVNIEDTLFAGAFIDECAEELQLKGDSALLAHQLYVANHENMLGLAMQSGHAERLKSFGIEEDLEFCMQDSVYNVVPVLKNQEIVVA